MARARPRIGQKGLKSARLLDSGEPGDVDLFAHAMTISSPASTRARRSKWD
jgi:hypothetical protein